MAVSPARAAAFEILLRTETSDAYASELLHSSRFAKLSSSDHGLVTELVMGVLRWRGVLDDKIAEHYGPSSLHLSKTPKGGAGTLALPDFNVRLAHPDWLVERWTRRYGPEVAKKICEHDQLVPETSVRVGSVHSSKSAKGGGAVVIPTILDELRDEGIQL